MKVNFLAPSEFESRLAADTGDAAERRRQAERTAALMRTMGLLGDKVFDITPGTPRTQPLNDGDTVTVVPALDYEAVIAQASGAVNDMVALTRDLRAITGGIVRGQGTLGQFVTNRALYDQLLGTLTRANVMLATYPELFAAGAIIGGVPCGTASGVGQAFERMRGQNAPSVSQMQ